MISHVSSVENKSEACVLISILHAKRLRASVVVEVVVVVAEILSRCHFFSKLFSRRSRPSAVVIFRIWNLVVGVDL